MNNQVKLMDNEKFLKWLDGEEAACLWEGPEGLMKYDMLVETINADEFAPDTPPVPTIKPGELVSIKSKPEYGTFGVESLRARIIPTANNSPINRVMIWELDDLEVVE